jgi:L-lysine 6-oxidase
MSDAKVSYRIHPAIGFARVGDAPLGDPLPKGDVPEAWYLEPTSVGGLPTELDENGDERGPVTEFKHAGQVRRQAARFRVYRYVDGKPPVEVSAGNGLESVKWTVHIANKKTAWYAYQELQGDVMLGEDNTYAAQGVPLRNPTIKGDDARQGLIIDPGPRTLDGPSPWVQLDANSAPDDYPHVSFPSVDLALTPYPVTTLGAVKVTKRGELLVLGGLGNAGGPAGVPISSFAGGDGWYDDVGDGPVLAEIKTEDGETLEVGAWVVSGAPKLAPELVNVATLADTFIDVGVRQMGLCPALYEGDPKHDGHFKADYKACWERDIEPIFKAMRDARWVANVDAMVSVASPQFDLSDLSEANRKNRQAVFATFRNPGNGHEQPELAPEHQQLLRDGFPLMPLNSGDNSISNTLIEKFMALTPTQYFLLGQWAEGKCVPSEDDLDADQRWEWASPLDVASAGNAVGEPMAPGIEVTWTMRNPTILTPGDPFRVSKDAENYYGVGLSPSRDETITGGGCEPGDLTKRMAVPWQSDFFQCSIQNVNFTTPQANKTLTTLPVGARIPLAPTFFAYWWPAQSPYNVYDGAMTAEEQALDGGTAYLGSWNNGQVFGQNVLYHRGLNSFGDGVLGWKYLGFILNANTGPTREIFPFFTEQQRSYLAFGTGYYGLTPDGLMSTTQTAKTTSAAVVNTDSQNVYPVQWLVGN